MYKEKRDGLAGPIFSLLLFRGYLFSDSFTFALLGVSWLWALLFADGEVTDDFDHYSEDDFQDFFTFLFHNGNFLY